MKRKLTEQELVRREKLKKLNSLGYSGFERNIQFSNSTKTLKTKYEKFSKEQLAEKNIEASIVLRVMTMRGPFIVGKDATGNGQGYVPKDLPNKILAIKELIDIGDIVWLQGIVMKTQTGTLSIKVQDLKIVTKALKPLPEKFHGLKDVEERYRHRYVDLIMNEEIKKVFWTRAKIVSTIRQYFDQKDYMEAETPVLSPILGGAAAKPFTTHHNALNMPFYLRVATELPLKKLLVGGIERVYEIGRLFRNEGIDTTHNPEFTTIEFYEAYGDLDKMMMRTEELFVAIAKALNLDESVDYANQKISLKSPFKRINMVKAVSEVLKIDMTKVSLSEAQKIAKQEKIELKEFFTIGHIIEALFEKHIESTLIQPTFVYGHPIEISPLAAKNIDDPRFTDRAELFINGKEFANMFSELNDPLDQLNRFEAQLEEAQKGNDEANELDWDFINALEYGMPPAGGCGIGIDRLAMLFTNKQSIREVLLFPHLKNKIIGNKETNE